MIGYDTLYAIQDMEDDALVGVKSSARRLGDKAPLGIAIFYLAARCCCGARRSGRSGRTGSRWWRSSPPRCISPTRRLRADPEDGDGALQLFRSNRTCGLLVFLGMLVVGLTSR